MKNQSEAVKPRLRIVDTTELGYSSRPQRRKHRRQNTQTSEPDTTHYPLEMQPVLRATLEYGRRTHALGVLKGAAAMEQLVDRIKALGPPSLELGELVTSAERNVGELKQEFKLFYESD